MTTARSTDFSSLIALTLGVLMWLAAPSAAAGQRWSADYFPNVPLTTQDGVTVHFYDDLLKGKSVVINVIYTRCADLCPLETARLAQVQRLLGDRVGKDVFFYSISIDPAHDTPAVLKAYAERFHVGPGWLFLTGREADVRKISEKIGLVSVTDSANPDGHRPSLMIGNEPTGQWMRNSAVDNPKFLAATITNFFGGWRDRAPGKSYAQAAPLQLDSGAYLFQHHCSACHTIGKGDAIGPDLAGVTTRRDKDWLARYIAEPDRVLAEGDAIATALYERYRHVRMPNLRLGRDDVETLVAFLAAQTAPRRASLPKEDRAPSSAARN